MVRKAFGITKKAEFQPLLFSKLMEDTPHGVSKRLIPLFLKLDQSLQEVLYVPSPVPAETFPLRLELILVRCVTLYDCLWYLQLVPIPTVAPVNNTLQNTLTILMVVC